MELTLVSALAAAVVLGSLSISWGSRRFQLSTSVLAVVFALTATFWIAFLLVTIGITVRTIALAPA
jgi:ABC-type dipeptide/oligopeptide/nickel transport system permease component